METDDDAVLVLGGAGGVGEAIVRALVRTGTRTIATSRDAARLAALREALTRDVGGAGGNADRLTTVVGALADVASAERLRADVRPHGPLRAVVASLGGWWSGGDLTSVTDAEWDATLASLVRTHFLAARTFVPELERPGCRYLAIGGGAALRPVPGASLVSIAGAAQTMLVRALVAERDATAPLIAEFCVDGPVATSAPHHGPVTEDEITADEIAAAVVPWLLAGSGDAPFAWPTHRLRWEGPIAIARPSRP